MGKSTIHGVFSTAMLVYQRVGFTGGLQGHGLGFLWRWHLRPGGPAGRPSPKTSKDVQRILKDTSPSSLPPVFAFGCLFVGVGMWHVCGCARFLAVSISPSGVLGEMRLLRETKKALGVSVWFLLEAHRHADTRTRQHAMGMEPKKPDNLHRKHMKTSQDQDRPSKTSANASPL